MAPRSEHCRQREPNYMAPTAPVYLIYRLRTERAIALPGSEAVPGVPIANGKRRQPRRELRRGLTPSPRGFRPGAHAPRGLLVREAGGGHAVAGQPPERAVALRHREQRRLTAASRETRRKRKRGDAALGPSTNFSDRRSRHNV